MKKWYIGITFMLVLFMIISTTAVAVDLRSLSLSNESAETPSSEEPAEEVDSSDSADQNSDSELDSEDVQSSDELPQATLIGNQPPVAEFDFYQSPDDRYEFNFIDRSWDPDGWVVYWEWCLDEGVTHYEQNTTYSFSHLAKDTETVYVEVHLWVGDNGDPQEFDRKTRTIPIPPINPDSFEISDDSIYISSEKQSSSSQITSSNTANSIENAILINNNLQNIVEEITLTKDNSKLFSMYLNAITYDPNMCLIGLCDLHMCGEAFYSPKPRVLGSKLYLSFKYVEEKGTYTEDTINYKIEAPPELIGGTITGYLPFNPGITQTVDFNWTESATGSYDITVTISPIGGWEDTDTDDNDEEYKIPESGGSYLSAESEITPSEITANSNPSIYINDLIGGSSTESDIIVINAASQFGSLSL